MLRAAVPAIALAMLALPAAAQQQRPPPPVPSKQRPPVQPAAAQTTPAAPAPTATADDAALREQIKKELEADFDQKLDALREEMRDEARAASATAGTAQQWEDEWEEVKPKLDFLELDGYFRTRMDLFNNFDMDTGLDPAGFNFFPVDPQTTKANTVAGANMRLRILPTLNVSEEVRVKAAINVFDNLVLGATPDAGFFGGFGNQRDPFSFGSTSQRTSESGFNAVRDSIYVQRAWAEVRTPIGELRFGRMPTEFGLGMNWNDGNCLDCDHGDTVDRIMFASKIANHVIAPAIDFVSEGATSADPFTAFPTAQPFDRSQLDDARDYVLAIYRRDSDEEMQRMKTAGRDTFINYGLYFTYRTQQWDVPQLEVLGPSQGNAGGGTATGGAGYHGAEGEIDPSTVAFVRRNAWAIQPDAWLRFIHKSYRLELEFVTTQGQFGVSPVEHGSAVDTGTIQNIDLNQYGAVLQNELKLVDDKLALGLELGYASGDHAPGFGNFPGRADTSSPVAPFPSRGDWEGSQFQCGAVTCADNSIDNFRFNRDYHVDLILFREILGGVTDATYVKPSASYSVTEGLDAALAVIYSQVNAAETTPTHNKSLGVEIDAAINYLSDDGFVASIAYGVLFPMSGLDQLRNPSDPSQGTISAATAQAIRGFFGVVY